MTSSTDYIAEIALLRAQLAEKEAQLQIQSERLQSQSDRIEVLEEVVRHLKIKRCMPSSEKTNVDQFLLFDESELCTDPDLEAHEKRNEDKNKDISSNKPRGRKPISKDLPREKIFLYLTDEEKHGAKSTFFAKVKEELDIVPAKVRVLEYMQEKAVFEKVDGQQTLITAELPKHPLPGSLGSTGLIAHVITSKYVDGLPLYRIEKMLQRYGGELSRTTLANYVIKSAKVFQPLINLLREHQNSGDIIAMDETRVQVLKEPEKSVTSDKYMWVSLGGPPTQQSVLFYYDPSRSGDVPLELLYGFKGYLQTDGYAGYNAACEKYGLTHAGCMDHARRKFIDAQQAQPKGKKVKVSKADMALNYINKLYRIERQLTDLREQQPKMTAEQVIAYRQEYSVPLFNELKVFLEKNLNKVPKDSLTYTALSYTLNQWSKLIVYCNHSDLRISNIMAENAIRPFVVGRKAWLFADTPQGAHASAACYSLVETAKLNGLEPFSYLRTLLTKLPYSETVEQIEALLPWNVEII
ncbi:IS66 family transposase (plasmid) [Vibrio sp. SS-MA-C1-2]|uniref:IS66 family transposase n=1 Tax=Vibrio sp. SS-MA-C1-2 TaxID=2908646 RepID=UPI001F23437C|nr:IS66 family transposase [Vibrio sp. SS-MA-C1-2]UJF20289.1 IS66 family transposase [Vibrio sp. SS-MA-C1-2]